MEMAFFSWENLVLFGILLSLLLAFTEQKSKFSICPYTYIKSPPFIRTQILQQMLTFSMLFFFH